MKVPKDSLIQYTVSGPINVTPSSPLNIVTNPATFDTVVIAGGDIYVKVPFASVTISNLSKTS